MVPSKPVESYLEFSFLQEYEEFDHERVTPTAKLRENAMVSSTPPDDMEIPASSNVGKSSSMLCLLQGVLEWNTIVRYCYASEICYPIQQNIIYYLPSCFSFNCV